MAKNFKAPPTLGDNAETSYETWKKEIQIWQMYTSIEKTKQAPAIFLTLTGQSREAILEMDINVLNTDEGVEKLITKLDSLYLKDSQHSAYEAYDKFEKFSRPSSMLMNDYIIEFERLYNRLKNYKMTLPDGVLAYRFINSANISEQHKQLIRATLPDLDYKHAKEQIKKIFSDPTKFDDVDGSTIKVEKQEDVYYGSSRQQSRTRESNFKRTPNRSYGDSTRRRNRLDKNGEPSRCHNCGSIFHWLKNCPDVRDNNKDKEQKSSDEVQLTLIEECMTTLVGETLGMAILDSGCTKTVCGDDWLQCLLGTLSSDELNQVTEKESSAIFKFGNGEPVHSTKLVTIPTQIGSQKVRLTTDVIPITLPLLLSRKAMKRANTKIDFASDKINMFGNDIDVCFTSGGHYCIRIGKLGTMQQREIKDTIVVMLGDTLHTKTTEEKKAMAIKLHRQFSHPPSSRLKDLLSDANINDNDVFKFIDELDSTCEVCLKYKKAKPKPVVGMPMAKRFNETVALDLKEWSASPKIWFLHLIDHSTRYSASCVIKTKKKEEIIRKIFQVWISVFGTADKFLVDNGGEFNNDEFISMCENVNIRICTTAAYSPWSNGLVERHNAILGYNVTKIIEDGVTKNLDIAVGWSISAKNSLKNVHGFSPNQLVFGFNPNLPNCENSKLPALEGKTTSEVVAENLNTMNSARRAYIRSESSEKVKRALRHQVRTSGDEKFVTGDSVFYKRETSNKWFGPGSVIGQEGQQVLIKHGSTYVRVHPCRITHDKRYNQDLPRTSTKEEKTHAGTTQTISSDNSDSSDEEIDKVDPENNSEDDVPPGNDDVSQRNENDSQRNDDVAQYEEDSSQGDEQNDVVIAPTGDSTETSESTTGDDLWFDRSKIPKKKTFVKLQMINNDVIQDAEILSRGGKATGLYKSFMNVRFLKDNSLDCIDWNLVEKWKPKMSSEVLLTNSPSPNPNVHEAMIEELNKWKENEVYEVVDDVGQKFISVHWVITEKIIDGRPKLKARLVARGFEEEDVKIPKDSPTCSKESLRLVFTFIAANKWTCNSIDIKAAFLQGKGISRSVFLKPPKEASSSKTCLWKLKTCVYGLVDAPRCWYMRVKEELLKLNGSVSKTDPAIFFWRNDDDKLEGIMAAHVDDFCWGGNETFINKVIKPLHSTFQVGSEHSSLFKYLGLSVYQKKDHTIEVGQTTYIQEVEEVKIVDEMKRGKAGRLDDKEVGQLRTLIGQMGWIAGQTRADLSFEVCELSSAIKHATVEDLKRANKALQKAKKEDVSLHFGGTMSNLHIKVYNDSSFGNLCDGGSQGGYIIFLEDGNGTCSPIMWRSKRLQRVVKSTMAGETLIQVEAAEAAFWLSHLIIEICGKSVFDTITCYTDSRQLFEAVYSIKQITDRRLRIDISLLKEMLERKEIGSIVWIETEKQLANCLTKKGASTAGLLKVLDSSKLH